MYSVELKSTLNSAGCVYSVQLKSTLNSAGCVGLLNRTMAVMLELQHLRTGTLSPNNHRQDD